MALKLLTKTEMVERIQEMATREVSSADVKEVLACIDELVKDAISYCERVKIGGIIIEPKVKKATKARPGRNPATGEELIVAAKPASVRVAARVSKPVKDAAPDVGKLKRKLKG